MKSLIALCLSLFTSLSQAAIIGNTTSRVTHIWVKSDRMHVALTTGSHCGLGVIEIMSNHPAYHTWYLGLLYAMNKQYLVDFAIESCSGTYSRPAEIAIRGPLVQ